MEGLEGKLEEQEPPNNSQTVLYFFFNSVQNGIQYNGQPPLPIINFILTILMVLYLSISLPCHKRLQLKTKVVKAPGKLTIIPDFISNA